MSEAQENSPMVSPPEPKPGRAPTLYFIIGFKLLKGSLAALLALGLSRFKDNTHDGYPDNLPAAFQKLLQYFHVDPEKKFIVDLADRVAEITQKDLHWVVILLVVYSLFMLLQAVGLGLRVGWVVWLVIGESAFFVPVEVFELVHRPTWVKLLIAAANILIVWYLYANRSRLVRHHRAG